MVFGIIPIKIFCILISLLIFLIGEQFVNKSTSSTQKTSLSNRINNNNSTDNYINVNNETSSTVYGAFYNKYMKNRINNQKLSKNLNFNILDVKDKIAEADLKDSITAEEVLSMKLLGIIGLIICLILMAVAFNYKFFFLGLLFYVLGGILPQRYISIKAKARRDEIERSLPDFLDLLKSVTEAGLVIQKAIQEVTNRLNGPLAEEFQKVMIESKANGQWRYAMENMAFRNNIDSLSDVISDILISSDRGTPITDTLEKEANMMRKLKNSRCQEKAKSMSIRLIIPMAIFNFLPLMFLMVAPMIMEMSKGF